MRQIRGRLTRLTGRTRVEGLQRVGGDRVGQVADSRSLRLAVHVHDGRIQVRLPSPPSPEPRSLTKPFLQQTFLNNISLHRELHPLPRPTRLLGA